MPGKLIVIEGIDGAGGDTQSRMLIEYLRSKKIPCERVYYPDYGNPIGDFIHSYLKKEHDLPVEVQLILYAADMIKDKEKVLLWLRQGRTVIADRYLTSALAYQGLRGFPAENIVKFADIFGMPKPDAVIYLRISPETSLKRKRAEHGKLDRNEADRGLLEKVSKSYESLVRKQVWSNWFVIDGEKSIEEVFGQIKKVLRV